MNKSYIYLPLIFLLSLAIFYYFQGTNSTKADEPKTKYSKKIVVAACPTFYEILDKLGRNFYEVIKTQSTLESLALLSENKVDIVMAGRILKPDEPDFEKVILGKGYSFISESEQTIFTDDLKEIQVFTDIDKNEINKLFSINNMEKVDNVYDYINKGVVITTWENTDLNRAEIVHVYNTDGNRNIYSRIPILYYKKTFDLMVINSLKERLSKYVKQ